MFKTQTILQLLLLALLLPASTLAGLNAANPSVAKTINAVAPPPPPAAPAAPAAPAPPPPAGSDLDCTTYESIICTGGSALHKSMVVGSNIISPNMNSIKCSRDLQAHEQIDLSTHPGQKRDVEHANASEPIDLSTYSEEQKRGLEERDDSTSCDGYMTTLHGSLSQCTTFTRAAYCLNFRRDDKK